MLQGNDTRECQNGGSWSGVAPICQMKGLNTIMHVYSYISVHSLKYNTDDLNYNFIQQYLANLREILFGRFSGPSLLVEQLPLSLVEHTLLVEIVEMLSYKSYSYLSTWLKLGAAYRHCFVNGTWASPDVTACSKDVFQSIRTSVSVVYRYYSTVYSCN